MTNWEKTEVEVLTQRYGSEVGDVLRIVTLTKTDRPTGLVLSEGLTRSEAGRAGSVGRGCRHPAGLRRP